MNMTAAPSSVWVVTFTWDDYDGATDAFVAVGKDRESTIAKMAVHMADYDVTPEKCRVTNDGSTFQADFCIWTIREHEI